VYFSRCRFFCRKSAIYIIGISMNILIFRGLIVLFVALYVAAIWLSGSGPEMPAPALEYQRWLSAQPDPGGYWGLSCAVGHLADIVGLVLLFARRRLGLWFLLAGFFSCLGSGAGAGLPFLQTHPEAMLMGFVNSVWGALVCMAVVCREELFGVAEKSSDAG
jgi:hypothetical protein